MKKKLFVMATIFLSFAITAGSTLAYFTSEDKAKSRITSGNVKVVFMQDSEAEFTGAVPGDKVLYPLQIKNVGANPAWVRLSLKLTATNTENQTIDATDYIDLQFDDENWTKNGEYYYSNKPVMPASGSVDFLKGLAFSSAMNNDFQESRIDVTALLQAVQSENNSLQVGWPSDE